MARGKRKLAEMTGFEQLLLLELLRSAAPIASTGSGDGETGDLDTTWPRRPDGSLASYTEAAHDPVLLERLREVLPEFQKHLGEMGIEEADIARIKTPQASAGGDVTETSQQSRAPASEFDQLFIDLTAMLLAFYEHLGLGERPGAPPVPDVFRDGFAMTPTAFAAYSLVKAIHDAASGRGWSDQDGERVPTHTTAQARGKGAVHVSLRPPDGSLTPPTEVLEALWKKVRDLDDLTSDALLICLTQWVNQSGKPDRPVWITADAILDACGIKRIHKRGEPANWRHGHRSEDRQAAGRALGQLASIWLEISSLEVIPGRKRGKSGQITITSPALTLKARADQPDLDGQQVFLAALVSPGEWVREYWDLGLQQIGLLGQAALHYDPYREMPEKRLGKYLAFHFRWNSQDPKIPRYVSTLLDATGIQPDRRNPQRTRDRLEHALNRLQADGLIARWGYVAEAGQEAPARKWLPYWLNQTIWIEPPETIQSHYAAIEKPDNLGKSQRPRRAKQPRAETSSPSRARS